MNEYQYQNSCRNWYRHGFEIIEFVLLPVSFALLFLRPFGIFEETLGACLILLSQIILSISTGREPPRPLWIDASVVFFILSFLIAAITSSYSVAGIRSVAMCLCAGLLYFSFRFASKFAVRIQELFTAIVAFTLGVAAVLNFAIEFATWRELGFSDVLPFRRLVPLFSTHSAPGINNPMLLALAVLAISSGANSYSRLEKFLSVAGATLMCICIYLTFSRSLYLCLLGFLLGCCLVKRKCFEGLSHNILFALCVCALTIIGLWVTHLLGPGIKTILLAASGSQNRSALGRFEAAKIATKVIRQFPIFGAGPNTFPLLVNSVTDATSESPFIGQSFNLLLQITAEQGVIGLLALCFLSISAFRSWRFCYKSSRTETKQIASILFFGLVLLLVCNFSEVSIFINPVLTVTVFAILGLLAREETYASDQQI